MWEGLHEKFSFKGSQEVRLLCHVIFQETYIHELDYEEENSMISVNIS